MRFQSPAAAHTVKDRMMKKSLLFVLCLFAGAASAQEVYKCVQNHKVTISTTPCPPGATSTVVPVEASPQGQVSPEEEIARMRQKADAMERERLEREAARERAPVSSPLSAPAETPEAVNAHGRLNAARRKREAGGNITPPVVPAPAPARPPGASGASSTNNVSSAPKYIEI
jgi:hypothetical protein